MKPSKPEIDLEPEIELTPDSPVSTGINWYPGHMVKAIREIKEKLKLVDIVVEVRDARAPMATGNAVLEESFKQKSRIIIFNKSNLADPKLLAAWEKWYSNQNVPYMFINCMEKGAAKK